MKLKFLLIAVALFSCASLHAQQFNRDTLYTSNGFEISASNPLPVTMSAGTVTLSGSAEVVTPRTLTTGTLTLAASTTRFEFLVTQDFVASYITATGTTAVSGSGTIAYGIFANRAAPGRTLGASTIVITSGSGSGYDAH